MKSILTLLLCAGSLCLQAQFNPPWRGKKCAVVLTYDDAIDQHLDQAVPVLDSLGLKATFYITAFSKSVQQRYPEWKKLAEKGYELGNHTLFHPCNGGPGREWVQPEYDLRQYTVKRMQDEMRMTNLFLQGMDGKSRRTFAFTCGDMQIGDSSFILGMKDDFAAARAVRNEMHAIGEADLYNLDCYMVNNHRFEEMKAWVDKAIQTGSLLVILFHGVGGGNGLDVSIADHRKLLEYIKEREKDIMAGTLLDAADHIRSWQTTDRNARALQQATQTDYRQMLAQLKITSTRPGPSGNPSAPNAANADETKASPYTSLPDPLTLKNGKPVKDPGTWWKKRRPELQEEFEREIYGRLPAQTPSVKWELLRQTDTMIGARPAVTKFLRGHVDNSAYPEVKVEIQFSVTVPRDTRGRVPVIIEFGFNFPGGSRLPVTPAGTAPVKSWQEQVLERGWGFAILVPTSYQADNGAGLTQGIIGLCNKGKFRKPDDWGTLRAWAWGASRAVDYLETDPDVDAKKLAIEGLSRYGKAALVTMAFEPRLALACIGSSGAGGIKILRRIYGEQVENLASSGEYHWFAGNFIRYAADPLTQNDLPVDAHELLALCAPRPVFISSGSPAVEGKWVDAKGMFLGAAHAGPVYELLGKKGLGTLEYPAEKTLIADGDIAFRQHDGGHTVGPNWPFFLAFAERYFK